MQARLRHADPQALTQVGVYDLYSKTVKGIEPSLDGFAVTNASVVLTPTHALLLRFRRSFDATFTLALEQVCWPSRIQA